MNVMISARIDGHVLFKRVSLRSVRSTPRCPTNELCTLLMVEYVSLDNLLGSATIDRVIGSFDVFFFVTKTLEV